MMFLLFSCIDPKGRYHECNIGGFTLEVCMEAITVLASNGWQIELVKLIEGDSRPIILPANAFDGESMLSAVRQLEQEWKAILSL